MEKRRGTTFIALGAALAVLAGIFVFVITQNASSAKMATADVVVAAEEIPERTLIQPVAVAIKKFPVDAIPAGAFSDAKAVINKMSYGRINAGALILANDLVDTKGAAGLSYTLEKGRVLITFPASNIIGLGLVKPGDTVDIFITYRPKTNSQQQTGANSQQQTGPINNNATQTTMQNLKVVSVGAQASNPTGPNGQQQQAPPQPQAPSLVTFAMQPQDALFLKAMKDSEDLSIELVLRAAGDDNIYETQPVTIRSVLDRYGVQAQQ